MPVQQRAYNQRFKPELKRAFTEIVESAVATYFGSVVPPSLIIGAVIKEATQLVDVKLSCQTVYNAGRHITEVVQERTQKPGCAKLDCESQSAVVASMKVNDTAIPVVEKKVARQLLLCGLSAEAAIAASLFIGQKTDRHASPSFLGEACCKTHKLCEETDGAVFSRDSRLQKYAAKDTLYARTFARRFHEDRLRTCLDFRTRIWISS